MMTKIILGWFIIVTLVSAALMFYFPNERRAIFIVYIVAVLHAFSNLLY